MMKKQFNAWILSVSALFAATQLQAATPLLDVKSEPLFSANECVQGGRNSCYHYHVVTLKTGQQWLDDYFEQQARGYLEPLYPIEMGEDEIALKREELKKKPTKELINELLVSLKRELSSVDAPIGWDSNYAPSFLGQRGNIAMFSESFYVFSGGAHGLGSTVFTNFDLDTQKELSIEDILVSGKKANFVKLLQQAYIEYLQSRGSSLEDAQVRLADYQDSFAADNFNFTFTYRGILVKFAPYEVASYAEGEIDLELPYSELVGIVKTPFLANILVPEFN